MPKWHHVLKRDWTTCSKFVNYSKFHNLIGGLQEKKKNFHFDNDEDINMSFESTRKMAMASIWIG